MRDRGHYPGGPGLGNIAPEQSDYHQVVKGGGHGCSQMLVSEFGAGDACMTRLAFDLADKYRNRVVVMADELHR